MGELEKALDNLALAATNDTAILQQLTAANQSLTTTIATLTATNKKLVEAGRSRGPWTPASGTPATGTPAAGTPAAGTPVGRGKPNNAPHPGNYWWMHGHRVNIGHTSATCSRKATGHRDEATAANTLGGSERDKGWDKPRT